MPLPGRSVTRAIAVLRLPVARAGGEIDRNLLDRLDSNDLLDRVGLRRLSWLLVLGVGVGRLRAERCERVDALGDDVNLEVGARDDHGLLRGLRLGTARASRCALFGRRRLLSSAFRLLLLLALHRLLGGLFAHLACHSSSGSGFCARWGCSGPA